MTDFFCAYVITKQITEILIDLFKAVYRFSAPGIARAWTGNILPVVQQLLRRR